MTAGAQLNVLDPRSLSDIRGLARADGRSDEALRAAAREFEALFLQMMLKSMRQASPANGLLDNDQTRLYQELLDQQLASNLAHSKGTGLAQALFRQLGGGKTESARTAVTAGQGFPLDKVPRWNATGTLARTGQGGGSEVNGSGTLVEAAPLSVKWADVARGGSEAAQRARAFVAEIWPHALEAARATGIPARFMVAQAALETGWGAKQQKNADGSPTYNLFNIKAGKNWKGGATTERKVSECESGRWKSEDARFRSYSSYAEAFSDYASLLTSNPRYAGVLGTRDAGGFAQKLQNAGYATDPLYARKLTRIIEGDLLKSALGRM
jgi:flagellar protein FlgJ